jgi:hypothetical protein
MMQAQERHCSSDGTAGVNTSTKSLAYAQMNLAKREESTYRNMRAQDSDNDLFLRGRERGVETGLSGHSPIWFFSKSQPQHRDGGWRA